MVNRRTFIALAAAAASAPAFGGSAHAAEPPRRIVWRITVEGGGESALQFVARLGNGSPGHLGGGVAGTAFGTPALFFFDGSGVLTCLRLVDRELRAFEVFRTDTVLADRISGVRYRFDADQQQMGYTRSGPVRWTALTTAPVPTPLSVQDTAQPVYGVPELSVQLKATFVDVTASLRESLRLDDGARWGRVVGESFVGWQQTGLTVHPPSGGLQVRSGTYVLVRPLDTDFRRLHVLRGRHVERHDLSGAGFTFRREGYKYAKPWGLIEYDTDTSADTLGQFWTTPEYAGSS